MYFVTEFKDNLYCILNDQTGIKEWYNKEQVLKLGSIVKIHGVSKDSIKIISVEEIVKKYCNKLASMLTITPDLDILNKLNYVKRLLGIKYLFSTDRYLFLDERCNIEPLFNVDEKFISVIKELFDGREMLQSLDLSSFDTSKVIDMNHMLEGYDSLQSLDLSSFNTSRVRDMHAMFENCMSLQSLDLSSFDTSKVEYMDSMFAYCSLLQSLDLSSFDTSRVETMGKMFAYCSSLQSLDLSSFDTNKVIDIDEMFEGCTNLRKVYLSENCCNLSKLLPKKVEVIYK